MTSRSTASDEAGVVGSAARSPGGGRVAAARSPARSAVTVEAIRAESRADDRASSAGRGRGVRARSDSRRTSRTVPSAASTTGAEPSSRSRGSSTSTGTSLTTTVGAMRRSRSEPAREWCTSSASAASSSLRRKDSADPTRIVPKRRDTSSTR
jgi:hypothetical protein